MTPFNIALARYLATRFGANNKALRQRLFEACNRIEFLERQMAQTPKPKAPKAPKPKGPMLKPIEDIQEATGVRL